MATSSLRTESLDALLTSALESGVSRIGQVAIERGDGDFRLLHVDDVSRNDLQDSKDPSVAMAIALYDDAGIYRPLKTAPTLKHGWALELATLADLRLALDFLYPAALGNWRAWLTGKLRPVSVRETVNRQTGMYRITGKISDEQAGGLVSDLCSAKCMRQILWTVPDDAAPREVVPPPGAIPLLCGDPCCLYVAGARKVVKGIPLDQVE